MALNDIIWRKVNSMPNFRGRRFTNAHETLIWASKNKTSKYTFNYEAMKSLNGDLQMRSDCFQFVLETRELRIKWKENTPDSETRKPLSRVIMSSSNVGDLLDPFLAQAQLEL